MHVASQPLKYDWVKYPNKRDPTQAELFIVKNHPKRQGIAGTTYVYFQDTTVEGLRKTWQREKKREIPRGNLHQLLDAGWLRLREGDAVFSRSLHAVGPEKDVLQVWVTGGRVITREMKVELTERRDEILGPRSDRTRNRPVKHKDGSCTGGTAYERSKYAKSVQEPARCFTLGPSLESPTSIVAPVASAKLEGEEMGEELDKRNRLLQIVARIAMAAMEETTPEIAERLKERAELVNMPRIGSDDNWAYGTFQLNLATAKNKRGTSLKEDMGFFGSAHVDEDDDPGAYSHMIAHSDLPEGYEPGFFFILELGVFLVLDNYISINFNGRRKHGGTAPLGPAGQRLIKWAYRFVVIAYPPRRIVNGTGRLSLGALPNNDAFLLPPEAINSGCSNKAEKGWLQTATSSRATFVREGIIMMLQMSLVTFLVRCLLFFCHYLARQAPAAYNIEIDSDMFIQAFTTVKDGRRINTGPWLFAPGWRRKEDIAWDYGQPFELLSQDRCRSEAWARWDAYEVHTATHIPHVGHRGPLTTNIPKPIPKPEKDMNAIAQKPPRRPRKPRKPKPRPELTDDGVSEDEADTDELVAPDSLSNGAMDAAGPSARAQRLARRNHNKELHESDEGEAEEEGYDGEADDSDAEQDAWEVDDLVGSASDVQLSNLPGAEGEPSDGMDVDSGDENPLKRGLPTSDEDGSIRSPAKRLAIVLTDEYSKLKAKAIVEASQWGWPSLVPQDEQEAMEVENFAVASDHSSGPFINLISPAAIDANLAAVQSACLSFSSSPMRPLGEVSRHLAALFNSLDEHPGAPETAKGIKEIWPSICTLIGNNAVTVVFQRLEHQCIMLSNYFAWRWLDSFCAQEITQAFHTPTADGWISLVTRDVKNVLENRSKRHIFASARYGLDVESQSFEYTNKRPLLIIDNSVLLKEVLTLATRIIAFWLRFPTTDISRYQAWFIAALLETFGMDSLLLSEVWQAHTQLRHYVLGPSTQAHVVSARFNSLKIVLQAHPLSNPNSPASLMLHTMSKLITALQSHPVIAPPLPAGEVTTVATNSSFTPYISDHPLSDQSSVPRTPPTHVDRRIQKFLLFLEEALAVVSGPVLNPTVYQRKLVDDMDKLLPFRELAPSRRRSILPDGPFGKEVVATDHGFYSALIFRGITFATPFFMQGRVLYISDSDFAKARAQMQEKVVNEGHTQRPASFFCDTRAYGPPNPARKVSLAAGFERAVQNHSLAGFIARIQASRCCKPSFSECYSFLANSERFHQLGPLGGYLLTADYAYTGLIQPPTMDELAKIIRDLNKGAVNGLEMLGLIPMRERGEPYVRIKKGKPVKVTPKPKKAALKDVAEGFKKLYGIVEHYFPSAVQTAIFWDGIMLENSLCKYSRADGRKIPVK